MFGPRQWELRNLLEVHWLDTKLLTRDADGNMFIDESPRCVKHLLGMKENLNEHEKPYLPHVSRALGLSAPIAEQPAQTGMVVIGGSTILGTNEVGPLSATLQGWCAGKPTATKLLYRASRDTREPSAFHSRCGDGNSCTITLFQVGSGGGGSASVVGGFSSVSWTPRLEPEYRSQPGAFVFMLKDGHAAVNTFQPEKWGVKELFAERTQCVQILIAYHTSAQAI